jgi:glycosyltransferase involved in cell wall biosynthesis
MKISIITFYSGNREDYLLRALNSVYMDVIRCDYAAEVEHHIIGQGIPIPMSSRIVTDSAKYYTKKLQFIIHEWPENIGIGAGLNKILPECTGDLIFKMDDDCEIISHTFFGHAQCIYEKFPNAVFSPYPVGLINNPGGPPGFKHSIFKNDYNVYTLRHVRHVGGFARFAPASIMKNFKFAPDLITGISGNEDGQFSAHCLSKGIAMLYLENKMIVEHADSTLGQIVRVPEYFKNRHGESSMKFEVIE